MTERKKDSLYLAILLAVLILLFSRMLFTDKIIRAPDITNEFFWTIKHFKELSFFDLFRTSLHAGWDMLSNGGTSEGGGTLSMQFLFYRNLLFWLIPEPANIAWFTLLHMFFGAAGTYLCCRCIGVSRIASLFAGLVFAIAPENASLINAGHVQKIATISFVPWAFYFFERGFQTRRVIFFLTTGVVLAFQFFNMHWQIAYYTCLGIGVYAIIRLALIVTEERPTVREVGKTIGLTSVTMFFFLSTVAISLVPLADWSKDTTRGVQSGSNSGGGGLQVEEAMLWSLPPEEIATFVIPGFFGFSRQEGAYNTANIDSYYWGRMAFTQTTDYMGLLPWLLVPLALIFRRDRYTWAAVTAVVGGILFSMGKYTPFYWFLYEYFPGINHFRVPKMIMFIPVLGLAVLGARGFDTLLDQEARKTKAFRGYLIGVATLPLILLCMLMVELGAKEFWLSHFYDLLAQPTRYEQGPQLILQRWNNIVAETGIAIVITSIHAGALWMFSLRSRMQAATRVLPLLLIILFLVDTARVNGKFLVLQDVPQHFRGKKTTAMEYLAGQPKEYRVLPINGRDPMHYVSNGIPVMFTSNPVNQRRWQEFLDGFSFDSSMIDIMNVKYLVFDPLQYEKNAGALGSRYVPVFRSSEDNEVVLENRKVLPKAWLVPAVVVVNDPKQAIAILQNPVFDPRKIAIVESAPPVPLMQAMPQSLPENQHVVINRYESNRITITADSQQNSLLVVGEKYFNGWKARVDGKQTDIHTANHILRGVYLTPGTHTVEFFFDPLPFKVGKYFTLLSFLFFGAMLVREWVVRRRNVASNA